MNSIAVTIFVANRAFSTARKGGPNRLLTNMQASTINIQTSSAFSLLLLSSAQFAKVCPKREENRLEDSSFDGEGVLWLAARHGAPEAGHGSTGFSAPS